MVGDRVRGRLGLLAPQHPWEIPLTAVRLVAAALAAGRPGGIQSPRLNGLSE